MAGLPDLLFAKGPTLVQKQPEKSQILRQGAKKRSTVFSKVISNYKVKWTEQLIKWQCSSITIAADQQNR